MVISSSSTSAELLSYIQYQQDILNSLPMMVLVLDVISPTSYRLASLNQAAAHGLGDQRDEIIGRDIQDFMPAVSAERVILQSQACLAAKAPIQHEDLFDTPRGHLWLRTQLIPLMDAQGQVIRIVNIIADVTEEKQREFREQEEKDQIIATQDAVLTELSSPLLQISESTVVMPLIGAIDSRRVEMIMQELLTGVTTYSARFVIIDITGLPIVDTQVANALLHATQAVKLLGAKVVLTGIRPEVAQTLVGLGVDLSSIVTLSSLQSGIAFALRQR